METFTLLYTVLGGLGLFFYGMRSMSDGLQSAAGDIIKKVIYSLSTNRFMSVLVGIIVTVLVQSSSVTSVMVVGMVNAGLMSLLQAIGVIFGANIGTTLTAWIISIKIGKFGLLMVGLGIFPLLFSQSNLWKQIGRILFGLGLVYFGLQIMNDAFKLFQNNEGFLESISFLVGNTYSSYILSLILGCLISMMVQSSAILVGITITLATTGVIFFDTAVAITIGGNIGTTITALLASIGANTNAKKVARTHAFFNLFCGIIALLILNQFVQFVDFLVPGDPNFSDSSGHRDFIAVHIAAAHTLFNLLGVFLFLPLIEPLNSFISYFTPNKKNEEKHLIVLGNPKDLMPTTSILQAFQEIKKFREILGRMFNLTKDYLIEEVPSSQVLAKIQNYEQIADSIQKEITVFLGKAMERELTAIQSSHTLALIKVADELESVSDYLERLAIQKSRFNIIKELSAEDLKEFFEFFNQVQTFFDNTTQAMFEDKIHLKAYAERKSHELQVLANDMRDRHLQKVSEGQYTALPALSYSEMVVALRKIRSHTLNVSEAIDGLNLFNS